MEPKRCSVGAGHHMVPSAVYYTVMIQATTKGRGDNLAYKSRTVCRGHILALLTELEAAPERCKTCKTEVYFCTCGNPDNDADSEGNKGAVVRWGFIPKAQRPTEQKEVQA